MLRPARILEVLDSEPEVQDRAASQRPAGSSQGRVAFENVCFSYNGDEHEPVLKDVNLVAEPGETVAILGATGSGKSTLVHLIPRFYDVNEGRVMLDGVDVRDMPLEQLRAQIGVALQEAVLFTGTIRDNIRYGRPEATDEQVVAAAKAAQAHDFITALPRGLRHAGRPARREPLRRAETAPLDRPRAAGAAQGADPGRQHQRGGRRDGGQDRRHEL